MELTARIRIYRCDSSLHNESTAGADASVEALSHEAKSS